MVRCSPSLISGQWCTAVYAHAGIRPVRPGKIAPPEMLDLHNLLGIVHPELAAVVGLRRLNTLATRVRPVPGAALPGVRRTGKPPPAQLSPGRHAVGR